MTLLPFQSEDPGHTWLPETLAGGRRPIPTPLPDILPAPPSAQIVEAVETGPVTGEPIGDVERKSRPRPRVPSARTPGSRFVRLVLDQIKRIK